MAIQADALLNNLSSSLPNKKLMPVSLLRVCHILGLPPTIWMVPNPFKIYEFLEVFKNSGLRPDHCVLDLGCGKGVWTISLARKCRKAIGLDISHKNIGTARRFLRNSLLKPRLEFICNRLEKANLSSSSFDRIFSFCVLEHIENLGQVLVEAFRILKPGGELHLSVDSLANLNDGFLLAKHMHDHSVLRYFTPNSLHETLSSAGLEVVSVYSILTSGFAKEEFRKRILFGYKRGLITRLLLYKRFQEEDRRSESPDGIMLVARARRPGY